MLAFSFNGNCIVGSKKLELAFHLWFQQSHIPLSHYCKYLNSGFDLQHLDDLRYHGLFNRKAAIVITNCQDYRKIPQVYARCSLDK